MRLFSRRIHKAVSALDTVEISEHHGVRYLHLGNDTVQSAMRIANPYALELSYTQAMVSFLLFAPPPESALMVGLGGGSLVKFFYHNYPDVRICAVDIHPEVIRAAHQYFFVPSTDERLMVIQADAAEFIPKQRNWNAILLDGFDAHYQVPSLATDEFYCQCVQALSAQGVLTVNLWGSDPMFERYRRGLTHAFDGRVITLPAEKRGNIIMLAFKDTPIVDDWNTLHQRALELESRLNLPFTQFLHHLESQLRWMGIHR